MPLFFRCDNCNEETEVDSFDADLARNCEGCGLDMCEYCVGDEGFCDSCTLDNLEDLEDDDLETIDDPEVEG